MWRRYGIDSIKVSTADGEVEFYLLEENEVIARVVGKVEPTKKTGNYDQINQKHNDNKETARSEEGTGSKKAGSKEGGKKRN